MKKILYLFAVAALLLCFQSCESDFDEANTHTFYPTEAHTAGLLRRAQFEVCKYSQDAWMNGRMGMLYSQYWSQISYTNESRYRQRSSVNDSRWEYFYGDAGTFREIILVVTAAKENPAEEIRLSQFGDLDNQIAVSKIMKAYTFHIITDIWGDVPYSEALDLEKTITPKFDLQQDIYTDLLKELKEASDMIDIDKAGVVGDAIYDGDMEKWKKFANSLRMRIAVRTSKVDPDYKAKVLAAFADGAFSSNDDNAMFHYSALNPYNNPLNESAKTRKDFAISESFMETLTANNDPRMEYYADPSVNSVEAGSPEYIGAVYGAKSSSIVPNSVSAPAEVGEGVFKADYAFPVMSYDEVLFILAEVNDSESDLHNAIKISCEAWGVSAQDAETFSNSVALNAKNLHTQKYIALYMQGIQGWAEWRRTGYPDNFKQPDAGILDNAVPAGTYPRRRVYPTTVQNLNADNYVEAVKRQGEDRLSTRVWWDKE